MERLLNDFLSIDLQKEIIKLMENADDVKCAENQKTWYLGDSEVTIGKTPEGAAFVHYKVDKNKGIIKQFKDYLENIDDEIFVTACDNFETRVGEGALQLLQSLMENPEPKLYALMTEFKESVKDVVSNRIETLQKKYLV